MLILDSQLLSSGPWLYAKFTALAGLTWYSFSLEKYRVALANGTCKKSGKFFRAYNEVPTALAVLIVAYVVFKTFSWAFTLITLGVLAIIADLILDGKKKNS
jgi:putative membrane protein